MKHKKLNKIYKRNKRNIVCTDVDTNKRDQTCFLIRGKMSN